MRLSHLADYAVVLMTAAARRPTGARLSATELSGETGVPLPTAQKLMGQLATSRLLTSARGASGGFTLAKPGPYGGSASMRVTWRLYDRRQGAKPGVEPRVLTNVRKLVRFFNSYPFGRSNYGAMSPVLSPSPKRNYWN